VTPDHPVRSADLLEAILAATRRIVEVRSDASRRLIRRAAPTVTGRPGCFARAAVATGSIIAECKRRSPSRGVLKAEYDAVAIARSYARGGAAAISVLTEPTFFDGSLADLSAVREAVEAPVLRKDFIVTEYQLLEARAAGADAVLLIVAALSPRALRALAGRAASLGLDVLVEVHDAQELTVAIDAGAEVIGVNNRNLRTLAVDVRASDELMARIPTGVVAVSESGLKAAADLRHLRAIGYSAFLIGERFMLADDPEAAVRQLVVGEAEEGSALGA
jgi:indole-3-glycerol phosphate synthase